MLHENLFNIAEYSNLTKEEKMSYDLSLMRQWDQYSALETAREEGLEKGLEKGRKEGLEKIRQTAANFKKLGVSAEDIAKATGLTIKEINKL